MLIVEKCCVSCIQITKDAILVTKFMLLFIVDCCFTIMSYDTLVYYYLSYK